MKEKKMTVARGFIITIISGLAFASLGAGAGYFLGLVAPDYYRVVLSIPPDASLDTTQAGLGLGLTQGLAAGLIIGLVIVVSVTWYSSVAIASKQPSGMSPEK